MKQDKNRDNYIVTITKLRKTNDKETILKVVLKTKVVLEKMLFSKK